MGVRRPSSSAATASFGVDSASNSTTANLAGGATYTGEWEDVANYVAISVTGGADVGGQLYIDLSDDGANVRQHIPLGGASETSWLYTISPANRYARVQFVNGASAQSSFHLQTVYKQAPVIIWNRASSTLNDNANVLPVRIVTDHLLDEARSLQSDRIQIQKFGSNPSVAASTEEDIWQAGGIYSGWLTSASAVRIKSGGNANDTAAGTGARSVVVEGLDESWAIASETLTTAGTSASSPSTTTFIRVFRAYVADTGAYTGDNAAVIDVETTGGALVARIGLTAGASTGLGQTQLALYTIPAGYQGYIRRAGASVEGSKAADIFFWQRRNADTTSAPFTGRRTFLTFLGLAGSREQEFTSYLGPFPAQTDLWASAVGPSGGASVSADFDVVLVAT